MHRLQYYLQPCPLETPLGICLQSAKIVDPEITLTTNRYQETEQRANARPTKSDCCNLILR